MPWWRNTRLARAVQELRAAAGDRPFVLVLDVTRDFGATEKPGSKTYTPVVVRSELPTYQALGLLRNAQVLIEADIVDRAYSQGPPPPDAVP